MKVKCDLCGGVLEVQKGGSAVCMNCGLGHSMDRLNEMMEKVPSVEELVALFTQVPLNNSEDLLEDDPFDGDEPPTPTEEVFPEPIPEEPPKEAPEVSLDTLLSTLKPPASSPYEVQVSPRDKPRLDLMAKAYREESFLMLVDDVYAVGTVGADVIGTVSSGSVKPGDTLLINDERPCEVMAIEHHGLRQEYAWKGMYASILLKDLTAEDVSRGDILTAANPTGIAKPAENTAPAPILSFARALDTSDLVPLHSEQFVMQVNKATRKGGFRTWYLTVEGCVKQGCVANLDTVFLNGAPSSPWTVWGPEPIPPATYNRASAGMKVRLTLEGDQKVDPKFIQTLVGECSPAETLDHFTGTPRQFFNSLLIRQFHPKYRILTDVTCDGIPIPVTYMLCLESKSKLAVFLLDSFDNKQRYQVDKALKACKEAGIPAMQFFMDYSNTAHYVSMRIRKTLDKST